MREILNYELPELKVWNIVVTTTALRPGGGTEEFRTIKNCTPLSWDVAVFDLQRVLDNIGHGVGHFTDAEVICAGLRRPWGRETYIAYRNMLRETGKVAQVANEEVAA